MKSIAPGLLFAFTLLFFLHNGHALNQNELPVQINDLKAGSVQPKEPVVDYKPTRGQMLYENHCLSCHESQMHIRQNTKVKQLSQLHHFVLIRSSELKLQWGEDERNAVTNYLNMRFYKLKE